jgi:hypothetical protein
MAIAMLESVQRRLLPSCGIRQKHGRGNRKNVLQRRKNMTESSNKTVAEMIDELCAIRGIKPTPEHYRELMAHLNEMLAYWAAQA